MPNMTKVASSNIGEIGWEANNLDVKFTSGSLYRYKDVPESVYNAFLVSPSKGKFFLKDIKNVYECERIS